MFEMMRRFDEVGIKAIFLQLEVDEYMYKPTTFWKKNTQKTKYYCILSIKYNIQLIARKLIIENMAMILIAVALSIQLYILNVSR